MCPLVLSIGQAGEQMVAEICSCMSSFVENRRETDKEMGTPGDQTYASRAVFGETDPEAMSSGGASLCSVRFSSSICCSGSHPEDA